MQNKKTKLNDWEIDNAVKEIRKLKDEKNISWSYLFKHYPDAGSSSASALNVAVNKHSLIVNYEGILEFLREAKCLDRETKIDKSVREERANEIAKQKTRLGITYDEMFRFYKGHGKKNKHVFADQVRRGYGSYAVGLIKWMSELTPEALAELRKPGEEEDREYREHFEENCRYINEINEIKEKNGLTWSFLFENVTSGCKNKYYLKKAIETARGLNFKVFLNDLKSLDIEKIKESKKPKKGKTKQYKNRYGRPFEGCRLHKVYAKENGLFGLQREYLE